MFGSEILDVAIGLVFVYLILSLVSSAVQEGLEAWLKTRAVYLERGIRELLHDKTKSAELTKAIYEHPFIFGLFHGDYDAAKLAHKGGTQQMPRGTRLPSYIPRENFALALLDYVAHGPAPADSHAGAVAPQPVSLEAIRRRLSDDATVSTLTSLSPKLRRGLIAVVDASEGNVRVAQKRIEAWYDSAMDRVSGAYKRQTQRVLLCLGVALAVALNVDSLAIADFLYSHDKVRDAIVAEATAVANDKTTLTERTKEVRARVAQLNDLHLPIGWNRTTVDYRIVGSLGDFWRYALTPLVGWLMTGLAISLGAPFWFDLLNKIMVVRATVKPKEKSPDEASDDRQKNVPAKSAA